MQCCKLTPLQSRFAASIAASLLLVVIYFTLYPTHFAYAAELDSIHNEDHNHHRLGPGAIYGAGDIVLDAPWDEDEDEEENQDDGYHAEFLGMNRGIIGRSAQDFQIALGNNAPQQMPIRPNITFYFNFPNSTIWGNHSVPGPELPGPLIYNKSKRELHEALLIGDGTVSEEEDMILEESPSGNGTRLVKRQDRPSRTVYISVNACSQPGFNGTTTADLPPAPPQLTLYLSQGPKVRKPGPDTANSPEVSTYVLTEGFAQVNLTAFDTSGDVNIGIHGPVLSSQFSGAWEYEIAASIDGVYHKHNPESPFLFLVDSDTTSALLVTDNLTQADPDSEVYKEWMASGTPFTMFAFNQNNSAINGMRYSYCGLKSVFDASAKGTVESGITTRGLGSNPKEQFYIEALNGSSTYYGFLAINSNSSSVGGGGQVWAAMNFTTKTDGNCQVIFNLTFCSEVAYAVPSNPETFPNMTSLRELYDNYSSTLYQNFNYSLQQIPCNTTNTAQYSLARNCTDCASDYKTWLCAVTIPRCADFSAPQKDAPYLVPRNIGQSFISSSPLNDTLRAAAANTSEIDRLYANSSRNSLIDQQIQPGPYKEVLPCEDLCFSIVQSCPAALGFACPPPGSQMLSRSYGQRSLDGGVISCSYLGAVYYLNAGERIVPGIMGIAVAGLAALFLV